MWDQAKMQVWRDFKDDYEISDIVYLQEYNFLICGLSSRSAEGKICLWSLDSFRKIKEFYENGSGAGALIWEENIE